jgi:RPA family protein
VEHIADITPDSVQKRQVAFKVKVDEISNGQFIKEEGWKPNYVLTSYGNISRINIMAMIIAKLDDEKNYTVDDGSGTIDLRWFEDVDSFKNFNTGELVNIVGRIREYNNIKYILPEIIRKIDNPKWLELRKHELGKREKCQETLQPVEQPKPESPTVTEFEDVVNATPAKESTVDKLIKVIKEKDAGEGVDIDEVIAASSIPEADSLIKRLLEEGDIFEIKPGRIKVLE